MARSRKLGLAVAATSAAALLAPGLAAASTPSGGVSAPAGSPAPRGPSAPSGGHGGGKAPSRPRTTPPRSNSRHPSPPVRHRPAPKRKRAPAPPLLASFTVSSSRIFAYGPSVRISYLIQSHSPTVAATLVLSSGRQTVASISLGGVRTGTPRSYALTGSQAASLPEGTLDVRISASHLRASAHVAANQQITVYGHHFPLVGSFTYPPGGYFGAPRVGHVHQGQDLTAASGTPVVAPRGGTVTTVANQPGEAGYYIVLRGAGENLSYVFMHLEAGSLRVRPGQTVTTGQRLASVGATGDATGPHLHFEVWVGPWQTGGHPVDPMPYLKHWPQ